MRLTRRVALTSVIIVLIGGRLSLQGADKYARGAVRLVDEKTRPFPVRRLPSDFTVMFYAMDDGNRFECAVTRVSHATFELQERDLDGRCERHAILAELAMDPEIPGWKQEPFPSQSKCDAASCAADISILRPRKPDRKYRQMNYERGLDYLAKHSFERAAFFLGESRVSDDLEDPEFGPKARAALSQMNEIACDSCRQMWVAPLK